MVSYCPSSSDSWPCALFEALAKVLGVAGTEPMTSRSLNMPPPRPQLIKLGTVIEPLGWTCYVIPTPGFLLIQAYTHLLDKLGWKTLVILYENEDSLVKLQEVLKLPKWVIFWPASFFCSQTSNLLLCLPTNGAISLLQHTLDTLEHHFNVTGVIVPNSCTREVEKTSE